ncbi:MAG: VWA domain-containing protein [Meiothermus sp.]|uniref:vWA domain-containing protein n=1 Tax=Meiothermus sp. TaxID=1955249 RepID=UPI0025CEBB05|nr:VWA domain-containing protein [Meiothermus sp.]MCS7067935.1 VWA domain-containing protein [Meiothermus sp.]
MTQIRAQRAWINGEDLLRLEIQAPREGLQARRLDLALVIDRSGSMAGTRLQAAKEATEGILKTLAGHEVRLGLVAFNDEVMRSEGWVGAGEARFFMATLDAQGSTNLFQGWRVGCQMLSEQGRLRVVLLLTDGQANQGLTRPEAIAAEVLRAAQQGVYTSTVGIGLGYNEALLSYMAEVGGGTHLFLPDEAAPELTEALLEELSFLRGAVLDGVELRLLGARATPLLGVWERAQGRLGPMAPGEVRTLLLRLEPLSEAPVEAPVLEAEVLGPRGRERYRLTLPEPVAAGPDYQQVAFERGVAQLRQLYARLSDLEGPEQAQALLEAALTIRATLEGHRDPRTPQLLAQLGQLEARLERLTRAFEQREAIWFAKAFLTEADSLNSTHRKPRNARTGR